MQLVEVEVAKPEAPAMKLVVPAKKLVVPAKKLEVLAKKLEGPVRKLEVQVHCSWRSVLEEERERLSQEGPRILCRSSRSK